MRVVLDAGPVIHLSWLHRLDLLSALFDEVLLPLAVRDEVLAAPEGTLGLDDIRVALHRSDLTVHAVSAVQARQASLQTSLGAGEAEAIDLAVALSADFLISDDASARRAASDRGLAVTGTLGVLKLARERGLIDSVLPSALDLQRLGLWVSNALIEEIGRTEREAGGQSVG